MGRRHELHVGGPRDARPPRVPPEDVPEAPAPPAGGDEAGRFPDVGDATQSPPCARRAGREQGMKRYLIETWGCQMNQHDTEKMAGILEGLGFTATDDAAGA